MSQVLEQKIIDIIKDTINDLGFETVKVSFQDSNYKILEILIDRLDGKNVGITDCKTVSTHVSALLDVEDIIKTKYSLQISSAGIERPLINLADYSRFIGREAKITLKEILDNNSCYQGEITKTDGSNIYLTSKNKDMCIPFVLIKKAHLVFSDKMFKELLKNKNKKISG